MRDYIQQHWAKLSPLLDDALDMPEKLCEPWLQSLDLEPAMREALRQLIADASRPSLIDAGSGRIARALVDGATESGENDPDQLADWCGRLLGPFRLLRLIGQGGMASVFLAEREGDGFHQKVAVKVLRHGMLDRYEQQRFMRERQILARLEHPRIARLIDGGVTPEGVPWFAMEYVEGVPITDYCDRERLPVEARLGLFQQVCDAVAYAHSALVVHRDLKPSNILVSGDGKLKLLDFGIARLIDEPGATHEATVTVTSRRRLTPAYAAPEQWRGEATTTATDVYALGVLLHEMLVGVKPERRDDDTLRLPSAVLRGSGHADLLAQRRRLSLKQLRRRISGDLDMILRQALHADPQRRYPSAAAFAEDVDRHLDNRPVRARPESFWYRSQRFLVRHRFSAIAAGLVVVSLGAGVYATWRQYGHTMAAARQAQLQAQRAERVKGFLIDLLRGAGPNQTQGHEVTALELLQRGERQLVEGLAEDPALRAELLLTLAGIQRELGQYERARTLLAEAEALGLADALALALESARVAHAEGRFDEAEQELRPALAQVGARNDAVATEVRLELAQVLADRDRKEEAAMLAREAIGIAREHPDQAALEAEALAALARIEYGQGDLESAETAMLQALALQRAHLGERHTNVARNLNDLGVIRMQRGDLQGARESLREALDMRQRLLGLRHVDTASTLHNLGGVQRRLGEYDEAERYLQQVVEVLAELFPDGHPERVTASNTLAVIAMERGQRELAIERMQAAVADARAAYGPTHPTVATMLGNLASMLRQAGQLERAEAIQREGLELLRQSLGRHHHLYAVALTGLAFIELDRGHLEEARQGFDEAADVIRASLGASHPDLAAVQMGRAEVELARGHIAAAVDYARQSESIHAAALPAQHPRVRRSRLVLAQALARAGDCTSARELYAGLVEGAGAAEQPRLQEVAATCPP